MDWIKMFPYSTRYRDWIFSTFRNELGVFKKYDIICACGSSLAFLKREGVLVDMLLAYGSDLMFYPFRTWYPSAPLRSLLSFCTTLSRYQREAIQSAKVVVANMSHGNFHRPVERLGIKPVSMGVPMYYNKEKKTVSGGHVFDFLAEHDFVLFNHSQQLWRTNLFNVENFKEYGANKRNDRLIKGYARFLKTTSFKSPVLVMFEYGPDVRYSKDLVAALGITRYVRWMPQMWRRDIMIGLRYANLGFDMAREGLCGIGGVTNELLAAGVPAMTYTNGAITDPSNFYFKAPFVEVLTEEDIFKVLVDYESNPEKYARIGKASQVWFDENLGEGLAKKYYDLICDLADKKRLQ
ncbi:MAG: hypothetical protein D6732_13530 [Methanobacteriota archaeon]|nr:MAG: hypothetical protein D6732_13530 [Euryarchaeota archaeon]